MAASHSCTTQGSGPLVWQSLACAARAGLAQNTTQGVPGVKSQLEEPQ